MTEGSTGFIVISPHFDDAALSCGHWLTWHPASVLATVCSGKPGPGVTACDWDARSGFTSADGATLSRGAEDASAAAVVEAQQRLLGFLDAEYRGIVGRRHEDPSVHDSFETAVASAIGALIDDLCPRACLAPLGLHHYDHVATGRAARRALWSRPQCEAIAYADLPYAFSYPRALAEKLGEVRSDGWQVTEIPMPLPPSTEPKKRMVECYRSQMREMKRVHRRWQRVFRPGAEQFWNLSPRQRST